MTIEPYADHGLLIRGLGDKKPWQIAARLLASCTCQGYEVVPGWDSVALIGQADFMSADQILHILGSAETEPVTQKIHLIPVCLERGLDTSEVSERLGISVGELGEILASEEFVCEFLGFQPGFPYLSGLPKVLSGLPRRASPRSSVPAGSIGITGVQCGIYPAEVPGGWNLIGRTPLSISNLTDNFFPIAPGDRIQFNIVPDDEYGRLFGSRL